MVGVKGQTHKILEHLKSGKGISSMEAFSMFGCTRLSAKIFDLRRAGYDIETVMVDTTTRDGMSCSYATYYLKK